MSSKGLGTFWPPAPMTEEFWYGKRIRASGQRWLSLNWMNSGHIAKSADQGVLSLNQSRAMWQQLIVTLLVELTAQDCKIECCSVFPNLFGPEGNFHCWSILYFCTNSTQIHEYTNHDSSVNSVQWAPHDFGLVRVEFRHPSCHGCFLKIKFCVRYLHVGPATVPSLSFAMAPTTSGRQKKSTMHTL